MSATSPDGTPMMYMKKAETREGVSAADYCKAIAINVSGYARNVSVAWTFVVVCMIVAWSYSKIHPIMAQKRAIRRLVQR